MATKASPTRAIREKPVGELLWLAVTAVEFAVIMGIVCWPLSAELSPRIATSVASGSRDASIAPPPGESSSPLPSPAYTINRLPLPEISPLFPDQAVEGSSGAFPTPSLGAQAEPGGLQPSPPRDAGGPASAARRPQPARSGSETQRKTPPPSRAAPTLTPPGVRDPGGSGRGI
jgi:hypothetical protein